MLRLYPVTSVPGFCFGIAVEGAAAVGADVDAAVFFRVAGNVQQKAPLVAVVVDARPRLADIVGTEDAAGVVDDADHIQRRVVGVWCGFAETEAVHFVNVIELGKRLAGISGMVQSVKGRQPEVAFPAGGGVPAPSLT